MKLTSDVKRYYGMMVYAATGEGYHVILYIDWGTSPEDFKQRMIEAFDIDEYFQRGIEVYDSVTEDTPELVFKYWKGLSQCEGSMKFDYFINCS